MSRITLTHTPAPGSPPSGSTSLFIKPDEELYLKLSDGSEKRVGSGGGTTAPFLPVPEIRVKNPTQYQEGGESRNSHDTLFCLLPAGFDERFYDYEPEIWLYRFVKRSKDSLMVKKWVHPTHRNGTVNADGTPRQRNYYDGGEHFLNYKDSSRSLVKQLITGRNTEWQIPQMNQQAGNLIFLNLQPNLWFTDRRPIGNVSVPTLGPESFEPGDYNPQGVLPLHMYRPTGRSWRHTNAKARCLSQLFALRLTIKNPSQDAAELARRPRLFSGLSRTFRLRIQTQSPGNVSFISYRFHLT